MPDGNQVEISMSAKEIQTENQMSESSRAPPQNTTCYTSVTAGLENRQLPRSFEAPNPDPAHRNVSGPASKRFTGSFHVRLYVWDPFKDIFRWVCNFPKTALSSNRKGIDNFQIFIKLGIFRVSLFLHLPMCKKLSSF